MHRLQTRFSTPTTVTVVFRKLAIVILACHCLLITPWIERPLAAQSPIVQEKEVIKAAYLRNALNFARWPNRTFPSPATHFQLGIAGETPEMEASLRLAFEQLNHRIQNRKVILRKFKNAGELLEALKSKGGRACNALFIPTSEKENFQKWIQAAQNHAILLISDDPDFIDQGGTTSLTPNPNVPNRYIYNIHIKRLRAGQIHFTTEFLRIRSAVRTLSN